MYIPPHKRHLKDPIKPSPIPDSLLPKFKKNIDFKISSTKGNAIVYSRDAISRWFPIGSNVTEDDASPSLKLVPVSLDSAERRNEKKYFVLMNNNIQKGKRLSLLVL